MDRYAGFVAAKRGMAESLQAIFDSGAMEPSQTRDSIVGAVELLLRAGADDGSLRADVRADDVVSSLIGIFLVSGSSEQTGRMLDLLVAGSRRPDRAPGQPGAAPPAPGGPGARRNPRNVQPTERSAPSQNCARTAFLSGLPSPVNGSDSAITTRLGDCTEPLRSLTAAWISAVIFSIAASSRGASERSTTTAVTASPHFSSGAPTTHTWAIAGCSATTSSTSRGRR